MTNSQIPLDTLIQLRQLLHRNAELSGQEEKTAKLISGFLGSQRPTKVLEGIGGHGVAAVYDRGPGPTVMVRCELDALPIAERIKLKYASETLGVSHKCGHDGHMAIVAGLAAMLQKDRHQRGRVVLLFQPAEENGEGAKAVLQDAQFKDIEPDHIIALHNIPGAKLGQVICRPASFTPSVQSIIIKLHGRTSHAGEPDKGINPAKAIAGIVQQYAGLDQPEDQDDFMQVTPVHLQMGKVAYGISAGYGELHYTCRTWNSQHMRNLLEKMEQIAVQEAHASKLVLEMEWTQFFSPNQNNPVLVNEIKSASNSLGLDYLHKPTPFRWGEDFGLFTEKHSGAMFGLGAGEKTPALHEPGYDFPDELIPTGVKLFRKIIDQLLEK